MNDFDPRSLSEKLSDVSKILAARVVAGPDDFEPEEFDRAAAGEHLDRLRSELWRRLIPNRFQWAEVSDFEGEIRTLLDEWSDAPRGRNLILFGPVGSGKSHAAVAGCRSSFSKGLDVRFIPVAELLDLFRPGGDPEIFSRLCYLDRLILDDIGSEKASDWTAERIAALVNRRWLEELPTIATSNLQPEALEAHLGAPTYSRLVGSDAVCLKLVEKDRRRNR